MAIISTNRTSGVILLGSEDLVLTAGTNLTVFGPAIQTSAFASNSHAIFIEGALTSTSIAINFDTTTGSNSVVVGTAGSITSFSTAILMTGDLNTFVNNGSIDTVIGVAIQATGTNNDLRNTGTISAGMAAIQFGDSGEVFNSGEILSEASAIEFGSSDGSIINTGTLIADDTGVDSALTLVANNSGQTVAGIDAFRATISLTLNNTGTIEAGFQAAQSGSSLTVENTGSITSNSNTFQAGGLVDINNVGVISSSVGILEQTSFGSILFRNTGEIAAGDTLINGGTSQVTFQNAGTITADVGVDAGVIIFDNSGSLSVRNGAAIDGSSVYIYNAIGGSITNNNSDLINFTSAGEIKNAGTMTSYQKLIDYNPVTGTGNGLLVENSGVMNAQSVVFAFGSDVFVTNTGTMTATGQPFSQGYAVALLSNSGGRIVNQGTMTSAESQAIYGVNSTGSHLVKNSGTITTLQANTGIEAILLTNGVGLTTFGHTVINSGLVVGDISFSAGDDIYQGRLGAVQGQVEGKDGNDTLIGGAGVDVLFGDHGNDELRGGDGNDDLYGGMGDDDIRGGDGDDRITDMDGNAIARGGRGDDNIATGNGNDDISGGNGNDAISTSGGLNLIFGGRGDDLILGGTDRDEVNGGADDDRIEGNGGDDLLKGDKGEDTIVGGLGNDTVRGGFGDDSLFGNAGDDFLTGDQGNDLLTGGRGNDRIDGGAGVDTAVYAGDFADYTFLLLNNGDIRVTDNVGNDGIDRVSTVEFFEFDDVTVAVQDLFVV